MTKKSNFIEDPFQHMNHIKQSNFLEKASGHKYIKRTGSKGNYQYWYKDAQGKTVSGKEPKKDSDLKDKILNKLISGGNNPKESKELVNQHLNYILRVYPDASIKEMVNVMKTLGLKDKKPEKNKDKQPKEKK